MKREGCEEGKQDACARVCMCVAAGVQMHVMLGSPQRCSQKCTGGLNLDQSVWHKSRSPIGQRFIHRLMRRLDVDPEKETADFLIANRQLLKHSGI